MASANPLESALTKWGEGGTQDPQHLQIQDRFLESVIKDVPKLLKLCSATAIDQLVRQALPGIQLTHMTAPPSSIPVKLKYQYYSLNQSGVAWDSVRKARNLAAYVPDDFPNPQLELLILLPQTA